MTELIAETSPQRRARIAGVLYLVYVLPPVIVGEFIKRFVVEGDAVATTKNMLAHPPPLWLGLAIPVVSVACGIAATALFYGLFKPVNKSLSLVAAMFNLGALALSVIDVNVDSVFHGLFCLLVGYLIFKSRFLPRTLGWFMALAGLGWLASLSPSLVIYFSHYIWDGVVLAELSLCVWLLVMGVNVQGWREQASAGRRVPNYSK
jgi:hypothetical protein